MKKTQRLDKVLSHMGYGTRSEIRKMVKGRSIQVNSTAVKDSGLQVDPTLDTIQINGKFVIYREHIYLMMNKPQDVISATEDNRDRTVLDLLPSEYRAFEPFPVGRLDKDTVGLLLLTNDGKLAHNLLSPRKHVAKTYYAEVEGRVDQADIEAFDKGVQLDDFITMPAKLVILSVSQEEAGLSESAGAPLHPCSRIELTIQEGKFHQVKRMFLARGKKVTFLKRLSMGPLRLDDSLAPGEYRELTENELAVLAGSDKSE
ncbi:MAG TPA: pseudouridine synthase [Bacilli bacterium]